MISVCMITLNYFLGNGSAQQPLHNPSPKTMESREPWG
jgi:hypothetical protein